MNKNLISTALLLCTAFYSFTGIARENKDLQINHTMKQIGTVMLDMYPTLLDDTSKYAEKNPGIIATQVNRLFFLLKSAKPHFNKRSSTFLVSYDVLMQHLSETQQAINNNNLRYANNLLKEVMVICSSCHTQDSKQRTLFNSPNRKLFNSDFQFAEFNYLTRNYGQAIRYYEKYLKSLGKHKPHADKKTITTLKRMLTIYLQVFNEPGKARQRFSVYSKSGNLSRLGLTTLEQWDIGLKQLDRNPVVNPGAVSFQQLENYVHRYLGPLKDAGEALVPTRTQKVFHVWLQGLLYKYLSNKPTADQIPKILYWLALNARATNYSYYYSLSDLYLKECMLKHSPHPYAKKCFDEYKEALEFSYSGSLGTHIPKEMLQDLKRLRSRVYGN